MAQGEILAAYSKYFPETKGVEGVWRCETYGARLELASIVRRDIGSIVSCLGL
jgi:hypothetical protein